MRRAELQWGRDSKVADRPLVAVGVRPYDYTLQWGRDSKVADSA